MANDFDPVASIIEYWLFAHDLLAAKNGNDLTASAGGVGYADDFPAAPDHGLSLAAASNQWATITDAALSAGFPLKSGDAVKKVSWAFWFNPTTITAFMYMVAKYNVTSNLRSLAIGCDATTSDKLWIGYGTGTGGAAVGWTPSDSLVEGRTYHVGLAVDGLARTALVRLYDSVTDTATTYTKTDWGADLAVTTADFVVGNRSDAAVTIDFNGKIGGLVIADAIYTADQFDQIRLGTFNQANPSTLAVATSMQQVSIAGDYMYQPFIVF